MYRSKDTICSVSLSWAFLCVYADLLFLMFFCRVVNFPHVFKPEEMSHIYLCYLSL